MHSLVANRSDLKGISRTLCHLEQLNVKATEVAQWCANETAVMRSNVPPSNPRYTVEAADADLVLAIHIIKSRLPFLVHTRHVYGHQNGKGKRTAERAAKRVEQNGFVTPKNGPPPQTLRMVSMKWCFGRIRLHCIIVRVMTRETGTR